ncbi:MAG: hypothetical protein Q8M92_01245 [Candidatus Subteraquimicrobiales bacterium]|nr:hypothetical protein [Candidatus Subteraquimicrobiales bacterium]
MIELKAFNKKELLLILEMYDKYIQEANEYEKYSEGWYPVCINEFIDCEMAGQLP